MRAVRDGNWTIRHDKLKLFLWDLCRQAQMDPSSCEVHNVFAKHISSNYAPIALPMFYLQMKVNNLPLRDKGGTTFQGENMTSKDGFLI